MKAKGTAITRRAACPPGFSSWARTFKSHLGRLTLLPVALVGCTALHAAEVTALARDSPMLRFALGKLESALQRQSATMKKTTNQAPGQGAAIVVSVDPTTLVPDAAERIRLGTPWETRGSHGESAVRVSRAHVHSAMGGLPRQSGHRAARCHVPRSQVLGRTFFAGMAGARRTATFIYRAPLSPANTGSGGTTSKKYDGRTHAQIEGGTGPGVRAQALKVARTVLPRCRA